jgi:hypothetical protein
MLYKGLRDRCPMAAGFGSTLQPVQILRLGSTPDNGDVFSIIPYHAATSLCGFLWYGD